MPPPEFSINANVSTAGAGANFFRVFPTTFSLWLGFSRACQKKPAIFPRIHDWPHKGVFFVDADGAVVVFAAVAANVVAVILFINVFDNCLCF